MSVFTWISSLLDPVLKADFTQFANSGSITEAQMATALGSFDMELAGSGKTLSQSELGDLQSIASNIGSLNASPYLEFIADAFAFGNAANVTYTGGGVFAGGLGDLAVGYSSQALSKLIGKWFLGSDLPSDFVTIANSDGTVQPSTFTYQTETAPLYGPSGGPSMTDISQGELGDCYFLASLADVAAQDPSQIASMITSNGNGTYGVRFYVDGAARYVTVNDALRSDAQFDSNPYGAYDNLWGPLLEKAYAQVQEQGFISGGSVSLGNSFTSIGNDGYQLYALEQITGATALTNYSAEGTTWTATGFGQSFAQTSQTTGVTTSALLSTLAADLLVGDAIDLDSTTNASAGKLQTLVEDHSFAVYGFDPANNQVKLYNPWGNQSSTQTFTPEFEVSLNTLLSDSDYFTVANNGKATTVSNAPVVAASALNLMQQVTSFTVSDTLANVETGFAGLVADTKLSALTITGSTGGVLRPLIGLDVATTIDLTGNTETASLTGFASTGAGLGGATGVSFSNPLDGVLLGWAPTTIDYSLAPASGVETFYGFSTWHDLLSIKLNGGSLEQTLVGGGDFLSSSTDHTHGVFLAGVASAQSVTVSHGVAIVA